MKTISVKSVALLTLLVAASILFFRSDVQAQANKNAALSTNWVGSLVFGEEQSFDSIAGHHPFPKADENFQIGLRSDGVVVWRRASPRK